MGTVFVKVRRSEHTDRSWARRVTEPTENTEHLFRGTVLLSPLRVTRAAFPVASESDGPTGGSRPATFVCPHADFPAPGRNLARKCGSFDARSRLRSCSSA